MTIPIENQEIPQTGLDITDSDKDNSSGQITGLVLEYHASKKKLQGMWKEFKDNDCYFNFQFYTSNINPDGSMLKEGIANKAYAEIKGLPRGQRVFLRVRPIKNTWLGSWSEAIEKWIP